MLDYKKMLDYEKCWITLTRHCILRLSNNTAFYPKPATTLGNLYSFHYLSFGNLNTPCGSSLGNSVISEIWFGPKLGGMVSFHCEGFTNSTPVMFTKNTSPSSGMSSSLTHTGMEPTSSLLPITMLLLPVTKSSPGDASPWSDCSTVMLPRTAS